MCYSLSQPNHIVFISHCITPSAVPAISLYQPLYHISATPAISLYQPLYHISATPAISLYQPLYHISATPAISLYQPLYHISATPAISLYQPLYHTFRPQQNCLHSQPPLWTADGWLSVASNHAYTTDVLPQQQLMTGWHRDQCCYIFPSGSSSTHIHHQGAMTKFPGKPPAGSNLSELWGAILNTAESLAVLWIAFGLISGWKRLSLSIAAACQWNATGNWHMKNSVW